MKKGLIDGFLYEIVNNIVDFQYSTWNSGCNIKIQMDNLLRLLLV